MVQMVLVVLVFREQVHHSVCLMSRLAGVGPPTHPPCRMGVGSTLPLGALDDSLAARNHTLAPRHKHKTVAAPRSGGKTERVRNLPWTMENAECLLTVSG